MSESVLREVRKFVSDRVNSGAIVRVEWLTAEIIAAKSGIDGEDCDFYLVCAHKHIAELVKDCIGKYKPSPRTDAQIVLSGFEHLQVAYPVERQGERLLVPVHLLGDDELEARALEYIEMSRGCLAHAREIREFISRRSGPTKTGDAA